MEQKICVWCGRVIINPRTNRKYHERCYRKKEKEAKRKWKENNPDCDKKYYQEHKEEIDKKNREWKDKNKEKFREYQKNWAKTNKRKVKKSRRKYSENNKEKVDEINKKYYQRNKNKPEFRLKNKEKCIKWRKENPEKYKILNDECKKIYAKKYPEKVKARNQSAYHIKIPEGELCQICNKELAVERHHQDYSQPLDVLFLCRKCHKVIHRELKEEMIDNL